MLRLPACVTTLRRKILKKVIRLCFNCYKENRSEIGEAIYSGRFGRRKAYQKLFSKQNLRKHFESLKDE